MGAVIAVLAASKCPELRYSPAWEAAVYGTAPLVRGAVKGLKLPTVGLRGCDSDMLRPEVWSRWQHWQPDAMLHEVPGGHLMPLENPLGTAETAIKSVFTD